MSYVTNVIISFSLVDENKQAEVDDFWLAGHNFEENLAEGEEREPEPGLFWLDDNGGNKNLETILGVGAYNGLSEEGLVGWLNKISWAYPESVQLMVQAQEEDRFRELKLQPCGLCGWLNRVSWVEQPTQAEPFFCTRPRDHSGEHSPTRRV